MKICSKCKRELDKSNFAYCKTTKDNLQAWCRDCQREYDKQRNQTNKRREYSRDLMRQYREKDPEKYRKISRDYYINNIEKEHKRCKLYREQHKEEIKEKDKIRCNTPNKKVSRMVHHNLKRNNCEDSEHYENILGYTFSDLKEHLEKQFIPKMNWDNYSCYGWHIDHIIPQNILPYNSIKDNNFKICWCLENLRPLWCTDNLHRPRDGSDVIEEDAIYIISKALNVSKDDAKIKWQNILNK